MSKQEGIEKEKQEIREEIKEERDNPKYTSE